jgi:hypothetical protein
MSNMSVVIGLKDCSRFMNDFAAKIWFYAKGLKPHA